MLWTAWCMSATILLQSRATWDGYYVMQAVCIGPRAHSACSHALASLLRLYKNWHWLIFWVSYWGHWMGNINEVGRILVYTSHVNTQRSACFMRHCKRNAYLVISASSLSLWDGEGILIAHGMTAPSVILHDSILHFITHLFLLKSLRRCPKYDH